MTKETKQDLTFQPLKSSTDRTGTHIIGCRVPIETWNRFEIKCLEDDKTMSSILRDAINSYLHPVR